MTAPTPASRVTIARPSRSNGVLSIPASATQKRSGPDFDGSHSKAAITRLKIVIRRLPPGLTKAEFEEALGDDWKINKGRVDWAVYKEGKVSKEYGVLLVHLAVPPKLIQATQSCQTFKAQPCIPAPNEARPYSRTLRARPQYYLQ